MNFLDNDPLHAPINVRLARLVAASPSPPGWYAEWMRLGPDSSDLERLGVYQAIRDSGVLPAEAGFYLVSWQIDAIATRYAEDALRDLDEQLNALEESYGLAADETWLPGEAPAEWEHLRREYERAWDELYSDQLDAFDEYEMALLFETDRKRFDELAEAGRRYFFDAAETDDGELPGWLDDFVEVVAAHMLTDEVMGPLGIRYRQENGCWEVILYPTPVELVGGAADGAVVSPGFSLDLERLRREFERIDESGLCARGLHDPDGPCFWIDGRYRGRDMMLRVLTCAPEGELPSRKVDVTNGTCR